MHATRPHPSVAIPTGAAPPTNPSPVADGWDFLVTPPERDPLGLWSDHHHRQPAFTPASPVSTSRPHDISFPIPDLSLTPTSLPEQAFPEQVSKNLLDEESRLRHFQEGRLAEADEEWYKLVPEEAQEVLGREEVLRQSVIFEIIKSEREYVRDLQSVQLVFIQNLRDYSPINAKRQEGFITEVFWNLDEILRYHQQMLTELFARQMEQHPLIQGVADIVLAASVEFGAAYEKYIKHYPLSEAMHRTELRKNPAYQSLVSQCSDNPRIRRRDLVTFLSRPVTRLPRLSLLLQTVDKHTGPDLDDKKDLPLILELLNKYIKSSQPGIEAAESKVKFWALCESLVYQKGEIIDMDLYDSSRTLLHAGALFRRYRSKDMSHTWAELHIALLDNYLLILRPDERPNGSIRYGVVSRPIPLEYLQLGAFDGHSEDRKKEFSLPSFRSKKNEMFPFKVYHASSPSTRAYTFFARDAEERNTWKAKLLDALAMRKVGQDANKLFAPITVCGGFFKAPSLAGPSLGSRFTGKITCVAPFSSGRENFIAIGCPSGVYVLHRHDSDPKPKKVLQLPNPKSLHVLQDYKRFVILFDGGLHAYSLDLLARVALQRSAPQSLDASLERISAPDAVVTFAKVGKIGQRTMVFYTTKSFLQVYLHVLTATHPSEINLKNNHVSSSFRVFGDPVSISRDVHDITTLHKHIGVCTERGIQMADPTKSVITYPLFVGADGNLPMQNLQSRCSAAKPLGLVKCDESQLIVVFNDVGCYLNKDGTPARSSGYLRWETRADSFAHHGTHLILISSSYIEIRTLNTGKLVQVLEGTDMRLVHASERSVMISMKGDGGRTNETECNLVELVETAVLAEQQAQIRSSNARSTQGIWDEWDM
ncbi:hypothetical protein EUX98_g965 [Antrodiella citrinella]|uniref:DH domain-containing protein n=1 Tax=Antrodiella citrinella TaxID=2447956 RepID=A0A4S4N5H7_9APHY|nr:hypothetical protein EUX98_g965 [Antrodiella citrinella]